MSALWPTVMAAVVLWPFAGRVLSLRTFASVVGGLGLGQVLVSTLGHV